MPIALQLRSIQRQFGVLETEKALVGAREAGLEVLDNGTVNTFTGDGNSAKEKLPENMVLHCPSYK